MDNLKRLAVSPSLLLLSPLLLAGGAGASATAFARAIIPHAATFSSWSCSHCASQMRSSSAGSSAAHAPPVLRS